MNRPFLMLLFSGLLLYGFVSRDDTVDPIVDPPGNITELAEGVMVGRAADTAKAYRELSELLRKNQITNSYQLGQEMNVRVTTIDKETAVDLVAAMKPTFNGDTELAKDDADGIKKWQEASAKVLEQAAKGFERAAK